MLELFVSGFSQILSIEGFCLISIGVILGIMFGATPGLTTSMGLILLLPATYSMNLMQALLLLLGMYVGGTSGGLITAILLGIPGTPGAVPTTFDGIPMVKNGQAGKALGAGILFSFFGGMLSFIVLFTISPLISTFALKFTSVEYFSICLFSLALVASMAGKSLSKGIASALIGVMVSMVGLSPIDGAKRFTFGNPNLYSGFSLVTVLIGVYAVVEILKLSEHFSEPKLPEVKHKMHGFEMSGKEIKQQVPNLIQSSAIGASVGFLPGLGAGIASMLSWTVAKNRMKDGDQYGKGTVSGVISAASSGNAVIGGALIPLLTMGIPGDASTALLLAAFMMHGITPGPLLFENSAEMIYAMFACLVLANICMIILEYFAMPLFLKLIKIPQKYLLPVIIVLSSIGAFGTNNRAFDVAAVFLFAIIGYVFRRFKYPIAPMLMGFVVGPMVEKHLQRGLMLSYGSFIPFLTSPVSGFFLILTAVYLIVVLKKARKVNQKQVA